MQSAVSEPWELLKSYEYPLSHYDYGGAQGARVGGAEMGLPLDVESMWERTVIHRASASG